MNLTVETFVRIESRILMLNAFFLLEIILYEVLLNIERKSVFLEPVINTYQFPIHSGMNIIHVTVGCKKLLHRLKNEQNVSDLRINTCH